MSDLQFPPLFQGEALSGQADPFGRALALAVSGTDPGTVVHNLSGDELRASIIFAPEVRLEEAMAMLPVCGLGFQAALGALAPPEVAVHLEWDGTIRVNGAVCGRMRVKASTSDPDTTPDWLIVGLELNMISSDPNPGVTADRTWLSEEGCGEITPEALLEAWVRHSLYWINRWLEDGLRPVHADWRGLVPTLGEPIEIDGQSGTFVGVDENFGMLLRTGEDTALIPLSSRLET
ncbi:biotin/lipoate--protein ligase family protein [Roseibium sp. MMSF_3544]|uniref:biotin/lipoate--protein ligase family protein n=1 Tax=unclassified Roseibium TaxID=2629323 RepID=UPI00273F156D|nr:biotin/lipoate--protein ligase family protein [Roseibium sp. MMSF_3544]